MRLHSALVTLFLASGLTGCVIYPEERGAGIPLGAAELSINVSFGGVTTCAAAGINEVEVIFPNLDGPSFTQPCSATPTTISISNLTAGQHLIQVEGLVNGAAPSFSAQQQVSLTAGENSINLNLTSTNVATTTTITATFIFGAQQGTSNPNPPHMSCAEAGVTSVAITVDNGPPLTASCHDATTNTDSAIVQTTPGVHAFTFDGWSGANAAGTKLYSGSYSSVNVAAGNGNTGTFDLAGLQNGGFNVTWQLGSNGESCATAGAATVTYDVAGASGSDITGAVTVPCSQGSFQIPGEPAGVYEITSIKAQDANSPPNTLFSASNVQVYAPSGAIANFMVTLEP